MACYPPEADFVIRDQNDPAREIHSAHQFRRVRQRYETTRPNTTGRGWTPLQVR